MGLADLVLKVYMNAKKKRDKTCLLTPKCIGMTASNRLRGTLDFEDQQIAGVIKRTRLACMEY